MPDYSIFGAVINTICYTFVFAMMVWSHFEATTAKPGYLPKDKEMLLEELIPENS